MTITGFELLWAIAILGSLSIFIRQWRRGKKYRKSSSSLLINDKELIARARSARRKERSTWNR